MEQVAERVRERRVTDAFGVALLLVLGSVVVRIVWGDGRSALVVGGLLEGITLLAVLSVAGVPRRLITAFLGAALSAIVAVTAVTAIGFEPFEPLVPALWGMIVLGVIATILRRLRMYRAVTMQVVLGLLTVYLLLGLLFADAFLLVDEIGRGFFTSGAQDRSSFVYFSFVTLATVGYGDLVPAEGLPRALAVLEAIMGQLYMVTVVALAVSRLGSKRGEAD